MAGRETALQESFCSEPVGVIDLLNWTEAGAENAPVRHVTQHRCALASKNGSPSGVPAIGWAAYLPSVGMP